MPWNKGRFVGPKPPLKPKQAWAIRPHLLREGKVRDLAMFDLAIDSKLRGCDLVRLKVGQLVVNATVRHRATIIQWKTEKPVQFEMTEQARESLLAWLNHRGGTLNDYVFPSRARVGEPWRGPASLSAHPLIRSATPPPGHRLVSLKSPKSSECRSG